MQLDYDRIGHRHWRFAHDGGAVSTEWLSFLSDGTITGHQNVNERFWAIEDGVLTILNAQRVVTLRLTDVQDKDGLLILRGAHLPAPHIKLCLMEKRGRPQHNPTRDALAEEIRTLGWSIGEHSYGLPGFIEKGMSRLVIGKYCSIAGGVKIAFGDHRTDIATTYPFKALKRYWQHVPQGVEDHRSKGDVIIGNDVWIGTDVFIGSGICIGDGAVIGAKTVVVKDVPPYAIVAGNPGRIIRHRFAPDIIAALLELRWWDLTDEAVDQLLPLLMGEDITALIAALRDCRAELVQCPGI